MLDSGIKTVVKAPKIDKETGEVVGFIRTGSKMTFPDGLMISYNERHESFKITRPGLPVRYRSLSLATNSSGKVLTNPPKISTIKRKDLSKKLSKEFTAFLLENF